MRPKPRPLNVRWYHPRGSEVVCLHHLAFLLVMWSIAQCRCAPYSPMAVRAPVVDLGRPTPRCLNWPGELPQQAPTHSFENEVVCLCHDKFTGIPSHAGRWRVENASSFVHGIAQPR